MRKLAALFAFALFAGCASASNETETTPLGRPDDGEGGEGGSSSEGGTSAGKASKGGAAGKVAKGGGAGAGGDEPSSGAGGDEAGGSDAGTGGSVAAGTGGKGGAAGGANPCAGVACNAPPAKKCANETELEVFTGPGSCSAGDCTYASSKITCDKGCKDDACLGNACLGVSCNAPPAASCIGAQDLLAYDPGTCSEGKCTYPDKKIFCQFGCEKGACKGNPCSGKVCGLPPASFCSAADKLSVFESIGKCDNITGDCTYAKEEKFCDFGCEGGACKGDPCVGVSCTTPPASFCSDASTKKVSVSPGTCKAGSCTYATADQKCPFGCTNGVCKDCAADTDCSGGGKFCDNGTCRACDGDLHCGAACTNCVTTAQVCSAGACVACVNDQQCGAGKFCDANTCKTCDTAAKCGPSCAACGPTTPTCAGGTTCSCTDTSCGANNRCTGGACAFCNTAESCGPSCAPCGGTTPVCKTSGTTSACVECTTNEQCGAGKTCTPDNKCVPGCPPPADACVTGGQNRRGCGGARIIGRKVAGSAAGATIKDDTCSAYDESNESSGVANCFDAANDHHYRLYLRKGETAQVRVVSGEACYYSNYSYWAPTLKLYVPQTCTNGVATPYAGCGARNFCDDGFDGKVKTYTATEDGWLVIVVDGQTAFFDEEDEGDYTLDVRLTCSTGNCECP